MKDRKNHQTSLFYTSKLHFKVKDAGHRRNLIGDWFESLFHDLWPGSSRGVGLVNGYQNGDLEVSDLLFEVKGVSNGAKPQLLISQFAELMRNVPFPYSHLIYLICFYKVRICRNGISQSQLKEMTPTLHALDGFLAGKTSEVFAVHHRLLQYLLKNGNKSQVYRGDIIRLQLRELREISDDKKLLQSLGLATTRLTFKCLFRNFWVGPISLVIISPPQASARITKLFARYRCESSKPKENK